MSRSRTPELTRHASAVASRGRGVLILGAAGRGKSALALQLMAYGAALVADDRVHLARSGRDVVAWSPLAILGLIEARGVGLLRADPAPPAPLALVVDLDAAAEGRLPEPLACDILGRSLPLLNAAGNPHIAPAILQILNGGIARDR